MSGEFATAPPSDGLPPDGVEERPAHLKGNMGVVELAMSVLAFSAPLTTVAGFIPVLLTYSGPSAPMIYILVTALLLIFSVGFVAMARTVPNPGGFYAFVTAGLGRPAGLGAAFLATFGYLAIGFFAPSFFAVTVKGYLETNYGFPSIPWYVYGFAIIAVTTALAYRRIDLSAKVLTIVMACEIIAVIIFNVASFIHGGPPDGGGAGLTLPKLSDAGLGLAIMFALGNFLGFEATVIYREEVKDPVKTIPRAVYTAVASIGIFYAVAAWAFLAYFGSGQARAAAEADMAGMFSSAMLDLVGHTVTDIITVLLVSSILAAALSIQNASSRYLFSMGTDRVLPAAFGKVHPRHSSPAFAAAFVGGLWATLLLVLTLLGAGPDAMYAKASGSGTLAIIVVMFAASIAVVVYFRRTKSASTELTVWTTVIAPVLAAIGLGIVTWLAVMNYPDLLGGTGLLTTLFLVLTFGIPIIGYVYARILKVRKPDVYQRIGRQQM